MKGSHSHYMQLPTGWFACISADIMEVYFYNVDAGHSQWEYPFNDRLANTWKRMLSTDNLEFFVDYTTMQEVWHRTPQYRSDTPQGPAPPPNLYKDGKHMDHAKTQHIHQSIDQIK